MACFTAAFFFNLLIAIVVLFALIAIFKILIPWVLGLFGAIDTGPLVPIINIIFGAVIAILIILLIWELVACAFGGAGPHMFGRVSLMLQSVSGV